MILIDSKHFTSLNSGIISMRKNVGAIRKTLLKNRTLNLRLQTKQKLYDQQLKESEERRQQESKREQSRRGGGINLSLGNFLNKPDDIFKGGGGISDVLQRVVLFFSFALIGWMLKALPSIIKSVQAFIKSAQTFIQSLSEFWGAITGFFTVLWNGIEGLYKKLGLGGTDGLDETSEKKTRDMLADIATELGKFLKKLPGLVLNLVKSLVGQHRKARKIRDDAKAKGEDISLEEAARRARESTDDVSPTSPLVPSRRVNLQYLGKGKAMFGSTGNVSNAQGWVHGHFQLTPGGNINDLVSDVSNMVEALLQQGVPVELSGGQGFTGDMNRKKIEEMVRLGINQHTHSNYKRSVDIFVPKGTRVPFPVSDLQAPKGNFGGYDRGGISAMIPGSGKTWVGHLDPRSGAGINDGSTYVAPVNLESGAPRTYEAITSSGGPKVVEINETVVVKLPPSISKERQQRYNAVFSGDRKIEVISIDGESASSNPLFEN